MSDAIRLKGRRVKLKNRRVFAAVTPERTILVTYIKLDECRKPARTTIVLSPEAATATVTLLCSMLTKLRRSYEIEA